MLKNMIVIDGIVTALREGEEVIVDLTHQTRGRLSGRINFGDDPGTLILETASHDKITLTFDEIADIHSARTSLNVVIHSSNCQCGEVSATA